MIIGDYEIVETSGAGNHGTYHLARPPARVGVADPVVVLKVLDRRASADDFKRFSNELRLLHAIGSEHLVELLDAGSIDGAMFIATRHSPDGTLADVRHARDRGQLLAYVADAARGAHDLHEVGVAHRDIRPANVMIDGARARLGDLGLAQMGAGMSATVGNGPVGSLVFSDPDLLRVGRAGRATDIWSLGMTLHAALSDLAPYGELPTDSLLATFRHLAHTRPVLDPDLGDALAVVQRCLAPPDERFATALELAVAIDALTSTEGPPP